MLRTTGNYFRNFNTSSPPLVPFPHVMILLAVEWLLGPLSVELVEGSNPLMNDIYMLCVCVCVYIGGRGGSGRWGWLWRRAVCLSDIILNIGPKVDVFRVFLLSGCSILFPFFIRNVKRSFHCMYIAYSVFGEVLFAWVSFQPKGSTSSMTRRATL